MDLKAVLTDLEPLLSLIGSICVIAGTVFVVIQLRMNAKQSASGTAFDLIGRVTDPSFPVRRHLLYEVAAKYASGDWTGFDRSLEDFEVRGYANIYEQLGLLVRRGLVDLDDVMEAVAHLLDPGQRVKIDITSLAGEAAGSIDLDDAIFGLVPREDLIARMVRYQLAKRRDPGKAECDLTDQRQGQLATQSGKRAAL